MKVVALTMFVLLPTFISSLTQFIPYLGYLMVSFKVYTVNSITIPSGMLHLPGNQYVDFLAKRGNRHILKGERA